LEPITHFLTGACMGRAGLNRKTALATATVTLAAEAPDLDVLGEFKGRVFGFAHHRGFTHSFLGIAIVSAAVVGFVYLIWHLRGRKLKDPNLPPRWGLLFGFAYLAGLSHILLDYTNNYGVRPFWPFSEKWYSWDIVFIVEPVMLVLMVSGLVLPVFFSFIDREIGVRRKAPAGRNSGVAWCGCAVGSARLRTPACGERTRGPHLRERRSDPRFGLPFVVESFSMGWCGGDPELFRLSDGRFVGSRGRSRWNHADSLQA
jgi:inner membrane protein